MANVALKAPFRGWALTSEQQFLEHELVSHLLGRSGRVFESAFNFRNDLLSVPETAQNWKCLLLSLQTDARFLVETLAEPLKPPAAGRLDVG